MFTGEYNYSMDVKGRVSIPVKMREELGENFKCCKGFDGCLCVYPVEGWLAKAEKIKVLAESNFFLKKFFFGGTYDATLDAQGRVTFTTVMRDYAKITNEVVVIGNEDHIEIWAREIWDAKYNAFTQEDIVALVEKAGL